MLNGKMLSVCSTLVAGALMVCSALCLTCRRQNRAPDTPTIPDGLSSGVNDTIYTFTSAATDLDNDNVAVRFDWGDGDTSDWTTPAVSGQPHGASHAWTSPGTFPIKSQAKDTNGVLSSWSPAHELKIIEAWSRLFGGEKASLGYAVRPTPDGGCIATGYTYSYGTGEDDLWLIKTDASGNKLWDKTFGGTEMDEGYSVEPTSDGGYIIAGATGGSAASDWDFWLVKTDSVGNKLWDKTFGGADDDFGFSVEPTSDGGYAVTGYTRSFGAGSSDIWLVKTDASGNELWNKTFGGTSDDVGYSVAQTADGGYVLTGYTKSLGSGGTELWLTRTDSSGNEIWEKAYGGAGIDVGWSVTLASDGGYVVVGSTSSYGAGEEDIWLVKVDADGDKLWDKTFGGSADDEAYSIKPTLDGGYIVGGYTESFGAGADDVWLLKIDASGNKLWDCTRGENDEDVARSVTPSSDGGYIVVGWTWPHFGSSEEVWLIKTGANGEGPMDLP
jgi:hypothetical protein